MSEISDAVANMSAVRRDFHLNAKPRRAMLCIRRSGMTLGFSEMAFRRAGKTAAMTVWIDAFRTRMRLASRFAPLPSPLATSVDHRRWWL